jgi:spermidine synthase
MPTISPPARHASLRQAALYTCFALSGLAALAYQTAWTREFALVFGTSELAVATVLAAYMAGLALGARLIEGLLPRIGAPVRFYAGLEAGIALAAVVLVPLCLRLADAGLTSLFGHQGELPAAASGAHLLYYLLSAFATLLIPTTLMGATLPILVRDSVHSEREIGSRIGALYACNTAGAVGGALLTALVLLPQLGLRATQWSAGAVNLLVCAIALLLIPEERSMRGTQGASQAPTPGAGAAFWVLPLMSLSGAVAFVHEVLWARLLQRSVGSSVMAFGVMVASFLLGIALGGAIGSRLARTRAGATRWWILAQALIAVAAAGAWYALLAWARADGPFWDRAALSAVLLMPLTFAIGLTYPLAVRVLAADAADAARASARVYAWNTCGAILGALLGGFVLIPLLRYEGTLALVAISSLVLALGGMVLLARSSWRWWAAPAILAIGAALLYRPAPPEALLHLSPVRRLTGPLLYYGVGRSADVVVISELQSLALLSNGLPEAAISRAGEVTPISVESWMSAVAVLARPDIRSLLIVGFGGGNAVAAVPPSVANIDVIELEPEVLRANRAIATLRNRDPLADSRLNLILNDARSALALSDRRYDAIVSQPSHPWTAGASHLYTREFLEQAHAHLRSGGVFVQWMGAEFLDPKLLRSMLATLHAVFPQVRLYRVTPTALLLLASDLPLDTEQHPDRIRAVLDSATLHYARLGLAAPENLVAALALDTAGVAQLAAGAPLITDDDNRLAMAGVQERRLGLSGPQLSRLLAPYDPLTQAASFIHTDIGAQLAFDYIGRSVLSSAQADPEVAQRLQRLIEALPDSDQREYLRYDTAIRAEHPDEAARVLRAGLQRWPTSQLLNYALVQSHVDEFAAGHPSAEALAALGRLTGDAALVLRGVRLAATQDWQAVAQLDAALAEVRIAAPWGLEAAQLRVEWRARVANPELRQRYGDEALAIIDEALPQQPTVVWYALRAMSAVGTNRPEVGLESIASFTRVAEENLPQMGSGERRVVLERALALAPMLEQLGSGGHLDPERFGRVRDALEELTRRLR